MALVATWTKISPSISLHRSSLALSVIGDKAYIFGGELVPRTPLDGHLYQLDLDDGNVDVFKASEGATHWPSARVGSASAVIGTDLYIWGGRGGKSMSPSSGELYKFDTLTSTFSLVSVAPSLEGNQPEDRSFHVLTTHGSTLYLHAGCPIKGRLPTLHSLDISSSSPAWKALPSAPGPGRGGTNLALVHPPASSSPFFARFGGFAGHELSDLALFCLSTGEWSSPTLKAGSPTPAPRSVAGFVGLPAALAISPESAILAYLFLGEADPTAPEVGHDGAGGFHEASPVWAFCSTAEETVFEWKQVDVLEGGDRPEGLGWFGADWWEGGHGAVLFGGLESGNERRGDGWVLRIEVK